MISVGIIGATGYAGQQLVWFLASRKDVDLVFLSSNSYTDVNYEDVYKSFNGFIHKKCINIQQVETSLKNINILFIALPSGMSFDIVSRALKAGVKVIDLGADFRLDSPEEYKEWYKIEHQGIEELASAVYGLVELNREKIKTAKLIANPGCYPTASILALSPLVKNNLIDKSSIIIDAKSGVSGAGRSANIANLYGEVNESIKAYGVITHRHTPEIEQELSKLSHSKIKLTFTPHLVPMNRGMLVTCYANLKKDLTTEELYKVYNEFYRDDYFIKITDSIPETRWVKGSNFCHIGLRVDSRTNRVVVISAIDNLVKGAAGQAIQNMNLMFNLPETEGLEIPAMVP